MADYVNFARVRELPEFPLTDTIYFVQANSGDLVRMFITGDDGIAVEIAAKSAAQQLFDAGLIDAPTIPAMVAYLRAGNVSIGTVTTLPQESDATVTLVRSDTGDVTLSFGIPRGTGPRGDAGTLEIGTVRTGVPGTSVIITNRGTTTAAILDITIPAGPEGDVTPEAEAAADRAETAAASVEDMRDRLAGAALLSETGRLDAARQMIALSSDTPFTLDIFYGLVPPLLLPPVGKATTRVGVPLTVAAGKGQSPTSRITLRAWTRQLNSPNLSAYPGANDDVLLFSKDYAPADIGVTPGAGLTYAYATLPQAVIRQRGQGLLFEFRAYAADESSVQITSQYIGFGVDVDLPVYERGWLYLGTSGNPLSEHLRWGVQLFYAETIGSLASDDNLIRVPNGQSPRAKMLQTAATIAKVAIGATDGLFAFLGDSQTRSYGATGPSETFTGGVRNDLTHAIADIMNADSAGVPVTADSWCGQGGWPNVASLVDFDDRLTFDPDWAVAGFFGPGGQMMGTTGTGRMSFSTRVPCNIMRVGYPTAGAFGTWRYRIDGGAWSAPVDGYNGGAQDFKIQTINCGPVGQHTIEIERAGGNPDNANAQCVIALIDPLRSDMRQLRLLNMGEIGQRAANIAQEGYEFGGWIGTTPSKIGINTVFVDLGTNDRGAVTPATFNAAETTIVNSLRNDRGIDVAMVIPIPAALASQSAVLQEMFNAEIDKVSAATGTPIFIDCPYEFGPQEAAFAQGLYFDDLHQRNAGLRIKALLYARRFKSLCQ